MTKEKISWKKYLALSLVLALLIPGVILSGGKTAKGANLNVITKVENAYHFYSKPYSSSTFANMITRITLKDGAQYTLDDNLTGNSRYLPPGAKDLAAQSGLIDRYTDVFAADGYVYTDSTLTVKAIDKKFKQVEVGTSSSSYYGIGEDGFTWAWGDGMQGQLGTGTKENRSTPLEVVDPATDDPITGVKKIIKSPDKGVILLTDNKAYLVGTGFTLSSLESLRPLELVEFPSFNSPQNVNTFFLGTSEAGSRFNEQPYSGGSTYNYGFRRYVLQVDGVNYVSHSLDEKMRDYSDTSVALSSMKRLNLDPEKISLYLSKTASTGTTGFVGTYLNNGDLYTWENYGGLIRSWQPSLTSDPTDSNMFKIDSGVKKAVYSIKSNTYLYMKDNKLYGIGSNTENSLGTYGSLSTPLRIRGTDDSLASVVDIAVTNESPYSYTTNKFLAINDKGELYHSAYSRWEKATNKYGTKFIGFIQKPTVGFFDMVPAYVIDETGRLFKIGVYNQLTLTLSEVQNVSGIAPEGYVQPVDIEQPSISIQGSDDLLNNIVEITYGSDPIITTKEYSLDAGTTWLPYTAPITLSGKMDYEIQARAGDESNNVSEIVTFNVSNDPIVLTPGYPQLVIEKDPVTGIHELQVESGVTDQRVKVKVALDGVTFQDYSNAIELSEGVYAIEARLLNPSDVIIGSASQSYEVKPDTSELDAPAISQQTITDSFKLPIAFNYNNTQGTLEYRISGGEWIAYNQDDIVEVDNKVLTIEAKIVDGNGGESNITSYTTTPLTPEVKPLSNGDMEISVIMFPNPSDLLVTYSIDGGEYENYTGPVSGITPGNHAIEVKITNNTSGAEHSSNHNVTFVDPSETNPPGNGGDDGGTTPPGNGGGDGDGGTTPPGNGGGTLPGDIGTPVGNEDVNLTINSGGFSSQFNGLALDTIEVSTTNQYQVLNSVTNAVIEDSRGTGEGWHYSVKITDFISDPVIDTSINSTDLVVKIPSTALSVDVTDSQAMIGAADNIALKGTYVFDANPVVIARAQILQGMGQYKLPMDFTMRVPDKVDVVSSGPGSTYVPGQKTGLRVGTYRSVFTFTLTSGI